MFNNLFLKSCRLWDNVEKYDRDWTDFRQQYNMVHALCMLDN